MKQVSFVHTTRTRIFAESHIHTNWYVNLNWFNLHYLFTHTNQLDPYHTLLTPQLLYIANTCHLLLLMPKFTKLLIRGMKKDFEVRKPFDRGPEHLYTVQCYLIFLSALKL